MGLELLAFGRLLQDVEIFCEPFLAAIFDNTHTFFLRKINIVPSLRTHVGKQFFFSWLEIQKECVLCKHWASRNTRIGEKKFRNGIMSAWVINIRTHVGFELNEQ